MTTGKIKAALVGAALAVAVASGVGTYALWEANAPVSAADIRSADLDLTVGTVTWAVAPCLDPAVDPTTLGPWTTVANPGILDRNEAMRLSTPISWDLSGDNMSATITVSWPDADNASPTGVTATYRLVNETGEAITDLLPVGTGVSVGGTTSDYLNEPGSGAIEFFITSSSAMSIGSNTQQVLLGNVQIDLDQIRHGEGFDTP